MSYPPQLTLIIGIDLAWGDKKPDGVCVIEARGRSATILDFALPRGDDELLGYLVPLLSRASTTFVTVDAPIICPNTTGTRPVDRLTHSLFHREHAACHPANLTKCPRPPRILRKLRALGFRAGWQVPENAKVVAEVYPHPAMVRMFGLSRIVKYKKGRVADRKREFRKLQRLIARCLRKEFPFLTRNVQADALLTHVWSKPVEDQVDAMFCALIGLWHWHHRGKRSEVIGDLKTGFILLPKSPPARRRVIPCALD